MDARETLMVGAASDGKMVARPLSPHLQIYRPQYTSALSIFQRITGVGLGLGTILMVCWLTAAAGSEAAFARVQWFLGSILGWLLLIGWTLALFYHLCNGIRYLWWAPAWGLTIPQVEASAKFVLAAAVVLTALLVLVAVFA